jgi:demethylmenaquinone methyltransferase/2-methoxy-6-polyprenyl-1,4-benzoquinol methylase
MFDAIAPRYDLLNRVLSAGIDRRWRRCAIRSLGLTRQTVLLDVCSGTADVPLEARRSGGMGRVIGVDFARAMLKVGSRKIQRAGLQAGIGLVQADATRLPVRTASVDAVTVAFGIRNVERPEQACREMARTLKSGGRLAILEFGVPRLPGISTLYLWYFRFLLPRVGRFVSGHQGAYAYLPASVTTFPAPEAFCDILATAGFTRVSAVPLSLGIVYLYTAQRA